MVVYDIGLERGRVFVFVAIRLSSFLWEHDLLTASGAGKREAGGVYSITCGFSCGGRDWRSKRLILIFSFVGSLLSCTIKHFDGSALRFILYYSVSSQLS